ncbi:hypothetical protein MUA19_01150 [Staphylococcus chromogenes]|nr:hypothetical protein [Staphylococcus chromogenes]UXS68887.1 hypothetical protein MUA19_01150 [Staphylococcus chromogenes]
MKLIKRVSFSYRNNTHLCNRNILCSRLYAHTTKKNLSNPRLPNSLN